MRYMRNGIVFGVALSCVLTLAGIGSSFASGGTSTVGTILDRAGAPVAGVALMANGQVLAVTNDAGQFTIQDAAGVSLVTPCKAGVQFSPPSFPLDDSAPVSVIAAEASAKAILADSYEPDDTSTKAKGLPGGQLQSRTIHAVGNADWARFTLTKLTNVKLETSGTIGDTELYLYGPNSIAKLIEYDDNDGVGNFSMINRSTGKSLAPGTYYVKVREKDNNGTIASYKLRATNTYPIKADSYEADNTAASAKTIASGATQTHSLHLATDVDWVKFTLAKRSSIVAWTAGTTGNTELFLYGPNSSTKQIAYDDDSGVGYCSRIERTIANSLAAGVYYLKVQEKGRDATITSYTLSLKVTALPDPDKYEVDNTAGSARFIWTGGLQDHSIHLPTDVDWVKFTLAKRSEVEAYTYGTTGNTELFLYGPTSSTTQIAYDDDSGTDSFSRITLTGDQALAAGTYYLKVQEKGRDATISYYMLRLHVTRLIEPDEYEVDDSPAAASEISRGQVQVHSLHVEGDTDWAKFVLESRSEVVIDTIIEENGELGGTEIGLYGPDNSEDQIAYSNDFQIERTGDDALEPGTYYIRVQGYDNRAVLSAYSLNLQVTEGDDGSDQYEVDNTPETASTISDGDSQEHAIHEVGDTDWATFTLTEKSEVIIETNGDEGGTEVGLYGPDNSDDQIAYSNDGEGSFSRIELTGDNALEAGTYYIRVQEYANDAVLPAYTLSLQATPLETGPDAFEEDNTAETASTISAGDVQQHTIHVVGDTDWATFTLTEKSDVVIQTDGLAGSTEVGLYGPDDSGYQLDYDSDGDGFFSRIERTGDNALEAGTYYIRVMEWAYDAVVPAYTLSLQVTPAGGGTPPVPPPPSVPTRRP